MNTNQKTIRFPSSFGWLKWRVFIRVHSCVFAVRLRSQSGQLCHDLVRDRLDRGLGFGVEADGWLGLCRDSAGNARAPFLVIAKFAFPEAVARVGDTEALLDLEQVLKLRRRHRLGRHSQLRCDEDRTAIGFEDLHLE